MLWRLLFAVSMFLFLFAVALAVAAGSLTSPGGIPFGLTSLAITAAGGVAAVASVAVRDLQRRVDQLERRQPPGGSGAEHQDTSRPAAG